jgi:hypothetical protein
VADGAGVPGAAEATAERYCRAKGGAKNAFLCAILYYERSSFYPDRLGTNIGKAPGIKKMAFFLQEGKGWEGFEHAFVVRFPFIYIIKRNH